jgi:serine/threonine protein phosphatase PrpC
VLENFSGLPTHAWMAVFDGHGPAGGDCSRYAAKKLPTLLSDKIGEVRRQKSARSSHSEPTITSSDSGNEVATHPILTPEDCQSCIYQSFEETNQAMHRSIMVEDQLSGTTAIGVLFHDNHMTIANCGDSRAILGRKREHSDAPIKLSLIDAINGTTSIKPDPPDSAPESNASIQEEKPDQNPSDDEPPRIEPVKPVAVNEILNALGKDFPSATVEEISRDTNKEPSSAIDETGSQDHPFDELKPRIESPVPPSESPRQASPDPANNDSPETNVDIQDGPFDEASLQTKVPRECLEVTTSTNKDEENGTETISTTKSSNDATEAVQTGTDACIQEGDATADSVTDAESMAATTAPSFMALPLSRDQTPWRKDERERVKAAGACVWSIDQVEGREPFHDDWGDAFEGDKVVDYTLDPPRLWIAGKEYPGTAFTRSIGDWLAESIGVIPDPEMMTLELTGNDQIVVIASDGVFEFMTNQEVIDLCAQCSNPLEACEKVVQAAYQQWLVYENRTDDISVIVCFLRCSRPPIEGESGTTDELADALSSSDLNMSGASAQKMRYSRGISIVQSSNGLNPASIADALSQLSRDALIEEEEGSC